MEPDPAEQGGCPPIGKTLAPTFFYSAQFSFSYLGPVISFATTKELNSSFVNILSSIELSLKVNLLL